LALVSPVCVRGTVAGVDVDGDTAAAVGQTIVELHAQAEGLLLLARELTERVARIEEEERSHDS
jgi:hypothetical protein